MVLADGAFGKWLGRESAVLMNGVSALIIEPLPLYHVRLQEVWDLEDSSYSAMILDFQFPKLWAINICYVQASRLPQSVVYVTTARTDEDGGLILLRAQGMPYPFRQSFNIFISELEYVILGKLRTSHHRQWWFLMYWVVAEHTAFSQSPKKWNWSSFLWLSHQSLRPVPATSGLPLTAVWPSDSEQSPHF